MKLTNMVKFLKELKSLFLSVFLIALGLLTVWFTKRVLGIANDPVFVTVMLLPSMVYLIISGKLSAFKGPGGFEAAFVTASRSRVEVASESIEPEQDDFILVEKGELNALKENVSMLDDSKPIALTLTIGRQGYYTRNGWRTYMEALSQFHSFRFVIFLDLNKRFVAYAPSRAVLQVLKLDFGHELAEIVSSGDTRRLKVYPFIIASTLKKSASNLEALEEMKRLNLEALVVIDDDRKVYGIVERDQVMSRLLLSLARVET